jgi:hypothetical protein
MERRGDEVHVNTVEARGGATPHVARYVLAISLALVIIAFAVIVMTGALDGPQHPPDNAVVDERTQQ